METPVLTKFVFSANKNCESIPKLRYLSGRVAYEDDQTAIFHSKFAQIQFSVSKTLFCSHLYLQLSWWRHDSATSTSSKLKLKIFFLWC